MKLSTSSYYLYLGCLVASMQSLRCVSQELVGVRVLLNNGIVPEGGGSCTTSDHDTIQLSLNSAFRVQGSRNLHTAAQGIYLLQNYCWGECEDEYYPELCYSVCTGELTMNESSEVVNDNATATTEDEEAVIKHLHEVEYSEELHEQCDRFRATARAAILGIQEDDGAVSKPCLSLLTNSGAGVDFSCTVRVPREELAEDELQLDEGLSWVSSASSIGGFGILLSTVLALAAALAV